MSLALLPYHQAMSISPVANAAENAAVGVWVALRGHAGRWGYSNIEQASGFFPRIIGAVLWGQRVWVPLSSGSTPR